MSPRPVPVSSVVSLSLSGDLEGILAPSPAWGAAEGPPAAPTAPSPVSLRCHSAPRRLLGGLSPPPHQAGPTTSLTAGPARLRVPPPPLVSLALPPPVPSRPSPGGGGSPERAAAGPPRRWALTSRSRQLPANLQPSPGLGAAVQVSSTPRQRPHHVHASLRPAEGELGAGPSPASGPPGSRGAACQGSQRSLAAVN